MGNKKTIGFHYRIQKNIMNSPTDFTTKFTKGIQKESTTKEKEKRRNITINKRQREKKAAKRRTRNTTKEEHDTQHKTTERNQIQKSHWQRMEREHNIKQHDTRNFIKQTHKSSSIRRTTT